MAFKKKQQHPLPNNPFKTAVKATQEISNGFCNGLQALRNDSDKITVDDTKKLNGSVDIDACTHTLYPNDSRWDYAIGYNNKAYFVEIHPADTSNVNEMVKKADWLSKWLKEKAPALKKISANDVFYWIPSGRCAIENSSTQKRKLAQKKIQLIARFQFPIKK